MPPLNNDNHGQGLHRHPMIGVAIRRTIKVGDHSAMWWNAKITVRKATHANMTSTPIQITLWMKRNLSAYDVIMMRN